MTPLTFARLQERGAALTRWLNADLSVDRLLALDQRIRRGRRTAWPGRPPGPERRDIASLERSPT